MYVSYLGLIKACKRTSDTTWARLAADWIRTRRRGISFRVTSKEVHPATTNKRLRGEAYAGQHGLQPLLCHNYAQSLPLTVLSCSRSRDQPRVISLVQLKSVRSCHSKLVMLPASSPAFFLPARLEAAAASDKSSNSLRWSTMYPAVGIQTPKTRFLALSRFEAGGSQKTFKWGFQRLILLSVSILMDGTEQIPITVVSYCRLLLGAYICFKVAGLPRKSILVSG
jgi:hypothetical protein